MRSPGRRSAHERGPLALRRPSPRWSLEFLWDAFADGHRSNAGLLLAGSPASPWCLLRLDDLPRACHRFQHPSHVFAELAQAIAAAAFAGPWSIHHHPPVRDVLGERLAPGGAFAHKSSYCRRLGDSPFGCHFVFSGVGCELFKRQRQLIDEPRALEFADP
jgi:hypothetical protein